MDKGRERKRDKQRSRLLPLKNKLIVTRGEVGEGRGSNR